MELANAVFRSGRWSLSRWDDFELFSDFYSSTASTQTLTISMSDSCCDQCCCSCSCCRQRISTTCSINAAFTGRSKYKSWHVFSYLWWKDASLLFWNDRLDWGWSVSWFISLNVQSEPFFFYSLQPLPVHAELSRLMDAGCVYFHYKWTLCFFCGCWAD